MIRINLIDWFHRNVSDNTKPAVIGFVGAVIGGSIVACGNIYVNSRVVPAVQREQKHVDRQYESLEQAAVIGADCIQNLWNRFFALQNREAQSNQYRNQFQKANAAAFGLQSKFPVLFKDQSIAKDWADFLSSAKGISHALGEKAIHSEEEMKQRLIPVVIYLESVQQKIRAELKLKQ